MTAVVHDAGVLATDVRVADSTLARTRGLIGRRSLPADAALVFPFDGAGTRWLHMLGVPFAIDAVWLVDETVTAIARLRPLVGVGRARADTVIELAAGAAAAVGVGDELRVRVR